MSEGQPVFYESLRWQFEERWNHENQYTVQTCGMMVMLDRISCSPRSPSLRLSITMAPAAASTIRKRATVRELLPAPVRPTIPTYDNCHGREM